MSPVYPQVSRASCSRRHLAAHRWPRAHTGAAAHDALLPQPLSRSWSQTLDCSGPSSASTTSSTVISAGGRISANPPLSAAHSGDDSRTAKRHEQLLQEARRDSASLGDLPSAHRAGAVGAGQVDDRKHAVLALGRQSHPRLGFLALLIPTESVMIESYAARAAVSTTDVDRNGGGRVLAVRSRRRVGRRRVLLRAFVRCHEPFGVPRWPPGTRMSPLFR